MSVVFLAAEGDPSWQVAGPTGAERTPRAFDVAGGDPAPGGPRPGVGGGRARMEAVGQAGWADKIKCCSLAEMAVKYTR